MSNLIQTGSALVRVVRRLGWERPLLMQSAIAQWDVAVGEHLARVSRATEMRGDTLWVAVTDSAWNQEISLRREQIRVKINEAIGKEIVRDIRTFIGELAPKEKETEVQHVRPHKRNRYETLTELFAAIEKSVKESNARRAADERYKTCPRCGSRYATGADLCPACRFTPNV
jgi:hypothetical protein